MFIDSHAHLFWDSYQDDLAQVILRCRQAGLGAVINIGTDLTTSQLAIKLEDPNLKMYATVGLHPHDVAPYNSNQATQQLVDQLEQLYQQHQDKVVAIGECGLDYYFEGNRDFLPSDLSQDQLKQLQLQVYRAQVLLAKKLQLPLSIHCREAWSEIFIPELHEAKGVFHTFSGSQQDAEQALALGFYLSFSCILTYPKNETLRQLVKRIPLDKILTETDCPFLPPQAMRGQRNEPANVQEVVKIIAEIKGLPTEQVEQSVWQNTNHLFQLKRV